MQLRSGVNTHENTSDAPVATESVSKAAIAAENTVRTSQPDIAQVDVNTATPEADLNEYYSSSRQYAEQQQARLEANAKTGKPAQRFGGLTRTINGQAVVRSEINGNLTSQQKSAVRVLQHLSTAGDMNIVVHDTFTTAGQSIDETPNGYYDRNTNTLHISLDAEKSVVLVASHELTHFIQQWSPVQYENLKDHIRQSYNEQEAGLMDSLVRKKMVDLTAAGRENVTYAVAEDEVIADASETFLSDGTAINRLAKKNKPLAFKIADFVRTVLKDLAAALRGVDASSDEAIMLRENMSYFQKAQELWTAALEEAAEAHRYAPYNETAKGDVASIRRFSNGSQYVSVDVDQHVFDGLSLKEAANTARTYINDHFRGKVIGNDENLAYVNKRSADEYAYPANRRIGADEKMAKMRASTELDNLVSVSTLISNEPDDGSHPDVTGGWDQYRTVFKVADRFYVGCVKIKNTERGRVFHDVTQIKDITSRTSAQYGFPQGTSADDVSINSIRNSTGNSKPESTRANARSSRELLAENKRSKNPARADVSVHTTHAQSVRDIASTTSIRIDVENNKPESTRSSAASVRDLLTSASIKGLNSDETRSLNEYKRLVQQKAETSQELKRLQSAAEYDYQMMPEGGADARIKLLNNYIRRTNDRLHALESTKPLQDIATRERAQIVKTVEQQAKEDMRQYQKDARESANLTHYQNMVMKHSRDLMRWMLRPTDAKHVPEAYRKVTSDFLSTIDLSFRNGTIKDSKWRSNLLALRAQISNLDSAASKEDYSGFYAEIDPDMLTRLDAFISDTGEVHSIGDMNADQLKGLNLILTVLKKSFMESNECKANAKFKTVSDMGESSLRDMYKQKEKRSSAHKLIDAMDKFLNVDELDSFSYFEELGPASYSVLDGLRKGFDKRVRKIEQAMDYMSDLIKDDDVKKWSGKSSPAKTYTVSGGEIKLTTAQVMELYELSKRAQAQDHLYDGGIKSADLIAVDDKKKSRIAKAEPVGISEQDVKAITDTLTPRQKEVADAMQKFLEKEVAAWGNETSMQMYGYLKFFTKNYYPISVDKNSTSTVSPDSNVGLYAIKNVGATKTTLEEAHNALVINDIFDTFSRHVDEMASYNGLVAPLSDAMKWYNYKAEGSSSRGVKQGINRLMGEPGTEYFINFLKDINGATKASHGADMINQWVSRTKVVSVAFNLRVVLQQPTAYVRAAAVMDPKYLLKGRASKQSMQRMLEHSAIATWKSWGFFDTNLGSTMRDVIVGDQDVAGKIREAGLWAAGKADDITWSALWSATEAEIKDKRPELKIDSDEYFTAVSDRFSEIVDRTQVVDTLFHRSQMMRSKDTAVKMLTSFMAEPTKTYNMLRSATVAMFRDKTKESKVRFARVATTYIATGIVTAAAAAVADAFRDDDDEDDDGNIRTLWDKYREACVGNIIDNVNPLTLIPGVKDFVSMANGYASKNIAYSGIEAVINVAKAWNKYFAGTSKYTVYGLISKSVSALSKLTGIPAGSLLRTFESLYNTIAPENIPMKKAQLKK